MYFNNIFNTNMPEHNFNRKIEQCLETLTNTTLTDTLTDKYMNNQQGELQCVLFQ